MSYCLPANCRKREECRHCWCEWLKKEREEKLPSLLEVAQGLVRRIFFLADRDYSGELAKEFAQAKLAEEVISKEKEKQNGNH